MKNVRAGGGVERQAAQAVVAAPGQANLHGATPRGRLKFNFPSRWGRSQTRLKSGPRHATHLYASQTPSRPTGSKGAQVVVPISGCRQVVQAMAVPRRTRRLQADGSHRAAFLPNSPHPRGNVPCTHNVIAHATPVADGGTLNVRNGVDQGKAPPDHQSLADANLSREVHSPGGDGGREHEGLGIGPGLRGEAAPGEARVGPTVPLGLAPGTVDRRLCRCERPRITTSPSCLLLFRDPWAAAPLQRCSRRSWPGRAQF